MSKRLRLPTRWLLLIGHRDRWECHICHDGYKPGDRWVIDHDKALAKRGTNHLKNLRLAHAGCNNGKSDA